MRQIVIVIADLYFPCREGERFPAVALPGTLTGFEYATRYGHRASIKDGWRAWLARWLGRDDLVAAAPASIAAASTQPLDPDVWLATPVHLIAGLSTLHLDRRSLLHLSPADLDGLATDFQRVFSGSGLQLQPTASGELLMQGLAAARAVTTEPARALVSDLDDSLPKGPDAPALKRLGAELEMWLHEHPVNASRRKRGQLPVSTLWLWGGGSPPNADGHDGAVECVAPRPVAAAEPAAAAHDTALKGAATPSFEGSDNLPADLAFGSDAYVAGLWRRHGGVTLPLPDQLASVFSYPRAQRAVLVAQIAPMLHANSQWTVVEALAELDRRFVSPALAALRRGELESVVIVVNDLELLVHRSDRLKFWRRPRPGLEGLR